MTNKWNLLQMGASKCLLFNNYERFFSIAKNNISCSSSVVEIYMQLYK